MTVMNIKAVPEGVYTILVSPAEQYLMKLNFSRLREKIQSEKSPKTEIFDLWPREGSDRILNRAVALEKCSCIGCGV